MLIMNLFFRVFLLTFYFSFIIFKLDAQALGSYLFCVNKNNSMDWKWAKPNKQSNIIWAPSDNEGFWIKGSVWILNTPEFNEHSTLFVNLEGMPVNLNHNRIKRHAIDDGRRIQIPFILNSVCQTLIQTCVSEFGENFRHIGAAGHALARTDWGYVVADNQVCPNWNISNGLELNSESGYSLQGLAGQLALDIAAGSPEEKISMVDKLPVSVATPSNNAHPSVFDNGIPKKITSNTLVTNENLNPTTNINVNNSHANNNLHPQNRDPAVSSVIENNLSESGNYNNNQWTTITKRSSIPDRAKNRYKDIQDFYQRNNYYPSPKEFKNREGLIKDANGNIINGDLLEYDIPYPGQLARDKKRIVVQKYTNNWWYTKDHYNSFIKMDPI